MTPPTRYLLSCLAGIEPEVAADAEALGARTLALHEARVVVEADDAFAYRANLAHPTASRVHRVLHEGPVASLADVERLVEEVAWERVFSPSRSFAARSVRVGEHPFTSLDAARAAGGAVHKRFAAVGARPPVDLNTPDVTVFIHLHDAHASVCVDTTGPSLHMRPGRPYTHPAPLQSTLASAMIAWSGWDGEGALVDPLCGGGTVLIEAWRRARREPANLDRASFAFERLLAHDPDAHAGARDALVARMRLDVEPTLLGCERNPNHQTGARLNLEAAGAKAIVARGDIARYDPPTPPACVVTNPPWGQRVGSLRVAEYVGQALRERLARWQPQTAVVLVGNRRFEREPPTPQDIRDVMWGSAQCRMLRYGRRQDR